MKLKMSSSYSTLSRESLKMIKAGDIPIPGGANSDFPDCDTIPSGPGFLGLLKDMGCGQPITPNDCP